MLAYVALKIWFVLVFMFSCLGLYALDKGSDPYKVLGVWVVFVTCAGTSLVLWVLAAYALKDIM